MRKNLVRNMGQALFNEAYTFLKEWEGDTVEDDIERDRSLGAIHGKERMEYLSEDLDPLLFLEQYNLR